MKWISNSNTFQVTERSTEKEPRLWQHNDIDYDRLRQRKPTLPELAAGEFPFYEDEASKMRMIQWIYIGILLIPVVLAGFLHLLIS